MLKEEWLKKAKKLRATCKVEMDSKNGNTKCTASQASMMNQLCHVIGSHHGIHPAPYKRLKESLDESISWVESGMKDEKFPKKKVRGG